MARRAVIEAVILTNAWKTSLNRKSFSLFLTQQKFQTPISNSRCGCRIITNFKNFCSGRRTDHQLNCSNDENLLSSPSSFTENHREPPQEADRKAISEVSKSKGRVGQTTNMVFGDTVIDGSTGEWLTLNQKVNTYPTLRRFTAIGIGGDDFVQAMVVAVESVIQCPIPQGDVKQRLSSGGKYVSVNIGPVRVVSSEQANKVCWEEEPRSEQEEDDRCRNHHSYYTPSGPNLHKSGSHGHCPTTDYKGK